MFPLGLLLFYLHSTRPFVYMMFQPPLTRMLNELLTMDQDRPTNNGSLSYKEKVAAQENETLKLELNELEARVASKAADTPQLGGWFILL